jgi:hypothetical protein
MLAHTQYLSRLVAYQVRNQTITPDRLDRLLRRLRLLLSVDHRHVADMDLHEVVLARSSPQLAHSLNERHTLDVANCASQLNYAYIGLLARVINRYPGHLLYPILDSIGDVGHDLHRLAKVVAFALTLDDVLIDFTSCDVVVAREGDVEVTLVVAEIEIDFAAVREDEHFAVPVARLVFRRGSGELRILLRVHGSCVNIEVRVDLDRRDVMPGQCKRYASLLA